MDVHGVCQAVDVSPVRTVFAATRVREEQTLFAFRAILISMKKALVRGVFLTCVLSNSSCLSLLETPEPERDRRANAATVFGQRFVATSWSRRAGIQHLAESTEIACV